MAQLKVLNISTIIPLPALARENDIVLRVQVYLEENYKFKFIVIKPLPYTPAIFTLLNKKWKIYRKYQKDKITNVYNNTVNIHPYIMPPTSNHYINMLFMPLNYLLFLINRNKIINKDIAQVDLIVSQCIMPDSIIAYWISKSLGKPLIINSRGLSKINSKLFPVNRIIKHCSYLINHSPSRQEQLKKLTENYQNGSSIKTYLYFLPKCIISILPQK